MEFNNKINTKNKNSVLDSTTNTEISLFQIPDVLIFSVERRVNYYVSHCAWLGRIVTLKVA